MDWSLRVCVCVCVCVCVFVFEGGGGVLTVFVERTFLACTVLVTTCTVWPAYVHIFRISRFLYRLTYRLNTMQRATFFHAGICVCERMCTYVWMDVDPCNMCICVCIYCVCMLQEMCMCVCIYCVCMLQKMFLFKLSSCFREAPTCVCRFTLFRKGLNVICRVQGGEDQ